MLLEEFVRGDEHSFDSVVVDGRLVWHSISRYLPSPLDVLAHPWIQWCVLLPRDIDGPEYADIVGLGHHAVTALGLQTGLSHMEWFRRADGSLAVSEVGARPPGAQFMSLMSFAHDVDMYAAWAGARRRRALRPARAPLRRRRRVPAGAGPRPLHRRRPRPRPTSATRRKAAVVDVRLPGRGDRPSGTYEGDGYVIVRDRPTRRRERALAELISTIRLECG